MVEVRVTTKKVVALILSETEAKWLKGILQNPLDEDESQGDSDMRREIFSSLDSEGI